MKLLPLNWLFVVTVIWGATIPWLAPHPPMVDLPQHAAQIMLLKDLLLDQSPWAEYFRINWFTPYILGYGVALPLSFLMPITVVLKLMLSVAYIAFVWLCIKLRQSFQADPRLDWLFLISFFGFAYKWGFFTFLVASPLGLWLILLANNYSKEQSSKNAFAVLGVGLLTVMSHGLVFVFAISVGISMLFVRVRGLRSFAKVAWPFLILISVLAAYFLFNQRFSAAMPNNLSSAIKWGFSWKRFLQPLFFMVTPVASTYAMAPLVACVSGLLCIPWLLRMQINWRNHLSLIPFCVAALIMLIVPNYAFSTALLYQRFSLFLLPAYAWLFISPIALSNKNGFSENVFPVVLMMIFTWTILGIHTLRTWEFGKETQGIDRLISKLDPGQRGLAMVLNPGSEADNNINVYAHYPSWYQAEKHGLVDFNFAWFPPQIVRYKPEKLPAVAPGFEWNVDKFDWGKNHGANYDYFFVRQNKAKKLDLFSGATCPLIEIASDGDWTIYKKRDCYLAP